MIGLCHKGLPVTLLVREDDKNLDIDRYVNEGYVILSGEEMYKNSLSRRIARLNANPTKLRGGVLYPADPSDFLAHYDFELSDKDLLEITQEKVASLRRKGLKVCHLNPHCYESNDGAGKIVEFIVGYDYASHPVTVKYEFKPFVANIVYENGKRCVGDNFLTKKLVQSLMKKYPFVYEHIFIREQVLYFSEKYHRGRMDLPTATHCVEKAISYTGKKPRNAEELITEGLEKLQFSQLRKIREEDESE